MWIRSCRWQQPIPFLVRYTGSEYEIRWSAKIKMKRSIQPFECIPYQTASLSLTRIFYLYALGVSSAMLKKVAWSHQKTAPLLFKDKSSPCCAHLLNQNTEHKGHTGRYFGVFCWLYVLFFSRLLSSSVNHVLIITLLWAYGRLEPLGSQAMNTGTLSYFIFVLWIISKLRLTLNTAMEQKNRCLRCIHPYSFMWIDAIISWWIQ